MTQAEANFMIVHARLIKTRREYHIIFISYSHDRVHYILTFTYFFHISKDY